METVLGIKRPENVDTLILRNGEQLTGTLRNATFSMRTVHGHLKFDPHLIAGIDCDGGPQGLDAIITVNENRFSGFLEEPALLFKTESGAEIEVRREKVLKAIFRLRATELAGIPQRQFVQLKNGDFFTGQILFDQFQLTTAEGVARFNPAEMEFMKFIDGKVPLAKIVRRNGDALQGSLGSEDLEVQLDIGQKIRIYHDRIEVLYGREGYVPESRGLAAVQRPAGQGTSRPIPANPEGKSMEGMVWIPAGEFTMGSRSQEADRDFDEGPETRVIIAHGFWMGKYEVTQAEYLAVMGSNPSQSANDSKRPVEKVSWYEALKYCVQLTEIERAGGKLPAGYGYRLPTEAEWEYACRAGTTTRYSFGDDLAYLALGDYAWFTGNASSTTHAAGTKKPNPWGLHDMHGNVLEWCLDNWTGSLPGGTITNLPAPATGSLRVARGGSWLYEGRFSRSANRDDYSPSNRCSDLGFRVVLAPSEQ